MLSCCLKCKKKNKKTKTKTKICKKTQKNNNSIKLCGLWQ